MNIQGTIKRKSIYFPLPLIAFYIKKSDQMKIDSPMGV